MTIDPLLARKMIAVFCYAAVFIFVFYSWTHPRRR